LKTYRSHRANFQQLLNRSFSW